MDSCVVNESGSEHLELQCQMHLQGQEHQQPSPVGTASSDDYLGVGGDFGQESKEDDGGTKVK